MHGRNRLNSEQGAMSPLHWDDDDTDLDAEAPATEEVSGEEEDLDEDNDFNSLNVKLT